MVKSIIFIPNWLRMVIKILGFIPILFNKNDIVIGILNQFGFEC